MCSWNLSPSSALSPEADKDPLGPARNHRSWSWKLGNWVEAGPLQALIAKDAWPVTVTSAFPIFPGSQGDGG